MTDIETRYWLFKVIPSRFNLEGCLENMEKKEITWMTWQFKDDEKKASQVSKNDKFILWRSGLQDGSIDGVVGYGKVVRESIHEKAPTHVSDYHLNTTYRGNEKIFRINIEPKAWAVGNDILRARKLENRNKELSRKKLMPFDQRGSYEISESQYEAIIQIYNKLVKGFDDGEIIDSISPLEKKSGRRGRSGSEKFKKGVREAYMYKCAISGEKNIKILEAAHIDPYKNASPEFIQNNNVSNGILLRSDIHLLFDAHYIAINPDHRFGLRVVVSEEIENGKDSEYYKKFNNRELKSKPINPETFPNFDALRRRLERLK